MGSALDKEALYRGTSLYFADRVAPMLPEKLSNGICSLHPHADRLAVSVFMYIGNDGEILAHEIFESVINSCLRATYENVYRLLEGEDGGTPAGGGEDGGYDALREEYKDIIGDLRIMRRLAEILRDKRARRGALDFITKEAVISLDRDGAPLSVEAGKITFANQMIEEFMIACNETVASQMSKAGLPFIYRTHGQPDAEKIQNFIRLANSLGIKSKDIHGILEISRGTKYQNLLSYSLLRAMDKAAYTPGNIGHYGLASSCYCHFTSPIRRYPDLMIHRIIKEYLKNGRLAREKHKKYENAMGAICEACSAREREAEAAEREIESMKKAEYMKRFLGDTFEGIISGVASFGMFVELPNTVEGMVPVRDMIDDYYRFDPMDYSLTGEHEGMEYRIGDAVKVVLMRADPQSRQIDFMLYDHYKYITDYSYRNYNDDAENNAPVQKRKKSRDYRAAKKRSGNNTAKKQGGKKTRS